jgi:hypothetical protein
VIFCGRSIPGSLVVAVAAAFAPVARSQDASPAAPEAAEAPTAEPVAETPPPPPRPACGFATSYNSCTAACREMFPPKPKVETRSEASDRAKLAVHGWWALGVGAALLVAGGATGGAALHLNSELGDACPGGSCPPERHADIDTRDRLAVSSTVLLSAGIAASAVGTLILTIFSRPPRNGGSRPKTALSPLAAPRTTGVAWTWRF